MKNHAVTSAEPHRKRYLGTALAAVVAGTLTWCAVVGGAPAGQDTRSGAVTPVVDEAPNYAVEDFNHPQADEILEQRNVILKRGDGHITLADCASGPGLLEVSAREKERLCFRVVGDSGWLTMEIPAVYAIRGNDYTTEVDMTVGTEKKSFDIDKNAWTSVGEGNDEQGRRHVLVEIRTSK
ncbi:hypothetical protein ACIRD9_05340 [Streptomyces violaceus]|jgi:hypothetical protein|uniref:hypothetical protein n=1 Tax=Streptomyces violaceus TaxID=1936 RepID=UPI00382192F1